MKSPLGYWLVLFAGCVAWAGPAPGQTGKPRLPMQVQRELASMVKDCRAAGGKVGKSPGLLTIAELTGDAVADYIIDQSAFNCEGNASLFSGSGGSELIIFAGTAKDQAAKVFQQGVFEVKVDKSVSPAIVKVAVAGVLCGQRVTKNISHADEKPCWRPLEWSAARKKMGFAPVSKIEPMK